MYPTKYIRLYDVLIEGLLYIYISTIIDNIILKIFMMIIGIMTIAYNLNNLMYLDYKNIKKSYFGRLTTSQGKTQIHRLYNIFIMYPIFIYVYTRIPKEYNIIRTLFIIDIVGGIIYNGYYYLTL